jgi:hypothetical protein
MSYMALIFVACLHSECNTLALEVAPKSKYGCMLIAPRDLAKWEIEHPGWQVRGYMCSRLWRFK